MDAASRRFVRARALQRCEYSMLHESDSAVPHHIEHIVAQQHGGDDNADNLGQGHGTFRNTQVDAISVKNAGGTTNRIPNKASALHRPPMNIDIVNEQCQRKKPGGSASACSFGY
jgi:hypothetical protein